jgi:hypothetical protein
VVVEEVVVVELDMIMLMGLSQELVGLPGLLDSILWLSIK